MKASYSRSVNAGISVVLQQHRLRPPSPRRAALSKAGHTVKGLEGVISAGDGLHGTAESCECGLFGIITALVGWGGQ